MNAREGLTTTARDGGSVDVAGAVIHHLDLWTGAVTNKSSSGRGSNGKVELTGVKKLRELILELAVRGKLVEQNPTDEPASVLLSRIKEKKEELVKLGKIKRSRNLPSITDEEAPSDLPPSWACARAGDFLHLEMGQSPASKFYNQAQDGLPFFQGKADFGDLYPTVRYWCTHPTKYAEAGDILLSVRAPVGPTNISNISACIGRGLCALRPMAGVPSLVVLYMFRAIRRELEARATGTTFAAVSRKDIETLVLRVPPLPEQHRIVQKVDELMALCDRLEQRTSDQLEAHETLVDTLLGTLTQSQNATELADNWARLAAHFDTLFTTEQSIDKLKQTILQLAVMGRLVEQDAGDEQACILLERILQRKSELVHNKLFQKTSKLKNTRIPFTLPPGWVATRFGEVCPSIVPNRDKPKTFTGNIPWVTLPAFPKSSWYLDNSKIKIGLSEEEVSTYSARVIPPGSVMMSCVGRFGLTAINRAAVVANQQIHAFIPLEGVSPEFLSIAIRVAATSLEQTATSTTIKYLNKTNCESIPLALPPIEEQHRIVQKVDELMALCDQLAEHLDQASEIRCQMAEAIVEQGLSA